MSGDWKSSSLPIGGALIELMDTHPEEPSCSPTAAQGLPSPFLDTTSPGRQQQPADGSVRREGESPPDHPHQRLSAGGEQLHDEAKGGPQDRADMWGGAQEESSSTEYYQMYGRSVFHTMLPMGRLSTIPDSRPPSITSSRSRPLGGSIGVSESGATSEEGVCGLEGLMGGGALEGVAEETSPTWTRAQLDTSGVQVGPQRVGWWVTDGGG